MRYCKKSENTLKNSSVALVKFQNTSRKTSVAFPTQWTLPWHGHCPLGVPGNKRQDTGKSWPGWFQFITEGVSNKVARLLWLQIFFFNNLLKFFRLAFVCKNPAAPPVPYCTTKASKSSSSPPDPRSTPILPSERHPLPMAQAMPLLPCSQAISSTDTAAEALTRTASGIFAIFEATQKSESRELALIGGPWWVYLDKID